MRTTVIVGFVAVLLLSGCSGKTATTAGALAAGPSSASAGPPSPLTPSAPPPSSSPSPAQAAACSILPPDNIWHSDVSKLPVSGSSAAWVASIGASSHAHPDFGSGLIDGSPFGIPVTPVPAGQATVKVSFDYSGESDKGPYPIPRAVKVEGGSQADGDRHVILLDDHACKAYELYDAKPNGDGTWHAGSGAIYDLRSDKLRPTGWTSADAGGLPILAGLVRYDEVAAGHVDHAIRITVPRTQSKYVWPARHAASSSTDAALPPMGARFRLKASVDTSHFPAQARAIAEALKHYGAIVADNGSSWYLSGTEDTHWNNDALNALKSLKGSDFEAVDATRLMSDPNSGRATS
jgi:hypothetical protein